MAAKPPLTSTRQEPSPLGSALRDIAVGVAVVTLSLAIGAIFRRGSK